MWNQLRAFFSNCFWSGVARRTCKFPKYSSVMSGEHYGLRLRERQLIVWFGSHCKSWPLRLENSASTVSGTTCIMLTHFLYIIKYEIFSPSSEAQDLADSGIFQKFSMNKVVVEECSFSKSIKNYSGKISRGRKHCLCGLRNAPHLTLLLQIKRTKN